MNFLRASACMLLLVVLAGCTAQGDPSQPPPTVLVPAATTPADRLVVILPGRADDLMALRNSGAVQAVQSAWPDADVLLAELTLDYYNTGVAPLTLHNQVIGPARSRGYREVWLAGASLGGLGTLMYDASYPGEMDGLILLSPFVGERALLEEIGRAGGVAAWDPGPPQAITELTWQRELWRHIRSWSLDRDSNRHVWLAYGDSDWLKPSMPLLVSTLPADQVLVRQGGHNWSVWSPALADILQRARSGRGGGEGAQHP